MDHEEAVKRMIIGGPVPLEAASHVEACARCREEIEALRGAEAALRRARPHIGPMGYSILMASNAKPSRQKRRRWAAVAAAILLAGLLGGWSVGRMSGEQQTLAPPSEMALAEVPWTPSSDDSTLSLLQSAYPVADGFSSVTTADTTSFMETE